MNSVPLWFERKFDFTFPVELYPNLCTRLRGTPARLEEMSHLYAHESFVKRPSSDHWSAQEHAGHLLDLDPLWMARIDDYVAGASQLTTADLSNKKTHEANHNARPLADILAEFRAARRRLVSQVETIDSELFSRAIIHPRLKVPMRLVDHLYFAAEHDDHHLAQMWRLVND